MFLGLIISASVALDNGLGQTPGLGWNSDYCAGCHAQLGRDENINGFQVRVLLIRSFSSLYYFSLSIIYTGVVKTVRSIREAN